MLVQKFNTLSSIIGVIIIITQETPSLAYSWTTSSGEVNLWENYVTYIMHTMIVRGCGTCRHQQSYLTQFVYTLKCSRSVLVNCISEKHTFTTSLTAPYGSIFYESWNPSTKQWLISVYKAFIINVTVHKAHVPFSDHCLTHNVEVHEGHDTKHDSIIQRFCGFVNKEMVYTRNNKALIMIQAFTHILIAPIYGNITYEINSPHTAIVFNNSDEGNYWNFNIKPNVILYSQSNINMFWYVANKIHYKDDDIDARTIPVMFISHAVISINSCIHHNNTTMLVIYPGLLSYYWTSGQIKPYRTLYCNRTQHSETVVDFHMYATIALKLTRLEQIPSINITIHHRHREYINLIIRETSAGFTDPSLPSATTLSHGHFSAYSASLVFKTFEYIGEVSTAQRYVDRQVEEAGGDKCLNYTRIHITIGIYIFSFTKSGSIVCVHILMR